MSVEGTFLKTTLSSCSVQSPTYSQILIFIRNIAAKRREDGLGLTSM